jgi:regulator of protease activity HflC (stomatin/prohibitin superfamily)
MQRFGKFDKFLHPGMHILKWPMEREAGRISMRIQQLDVDCETKSRDHVFIRIHVAIQYQTNSTHLYESFYTLSSPIRQLTNNVHDIVRSTMPQLDLDDIFSAQDTIAQNFHDSLNDSMNQYGYLVHHVLITRIWPNEHVQQSMNEIIVSKRMKESMTHKAEAIKIEIVKNAEAKAERDYLIGVGVAKARREIVRGMRDTVSSERNNNNGVSTKTAMDLLLLTQYYSVLEDLRGCKGKKNATGDECVEDTTTSSTTLLLTHMPDTVSNLTETVRECFGSTTANTANLIEL